MTPHLPAEGQSGALPTETEITVRLEGGVSPEAWNAVRIALAALPSVCSVAAADSAGADVLTVRAASLLLFLAEVGMSPAFAGDAVTWDEATGLTIALPPEPPTASAGAEAAPAEVVAAPFEEPSPVMDAAAEAHPPGEPDALPVTAMPPGGEPGAVDGLQEGEPPSMDLSSTSDSGVVAAPGTAPIPTAALVDATAPAGEFPADGDHQHDGAVDLPTGEPSRAESIAATVDAVVPLVAEDSSEALEPTGEPSSEDAASPLPAGAPVGTRPHPVSRWLWFGASALAVIAVTVAIIALAQSSRATGEPPSADAPRSTPTLAAEAASVSTAEPTASPAPVTAAPATPAPQRWVRARDGGCIAPDGSACEPIYLALWQGNLGAWQAKAVFERTPLPDAAQAIAAALALRAASGDLATRLDLAAGRTQAVFAIEEASLSRAAEGYALDITLANLGNAASGIGGAQIVDQAGTVWWTLPANARLAAGDRCTLSAATTGPVCNGTGPATAGRAATPPSILLVRAADGSEYDRFVLPK